MTDAPWVLQVSGGSSATHPRAQPFFRGSRAGIAAGAQKRGTQVPCACPSTDALALVAPAKRCPGPHGLRSRRLLPPRSQASRRPDPRRALSLRRPGRAPHRGRPAAGGLRLAGGRDGPIHPDYPGLQQGHALARGGKGACRAAGDHPRGRGHLAMGGEQRAALRAGGAAAAGHDFPGRGALGGPRPRRLDARAGLPVLLLDPAPLARLGRPRCRRRAVAARRGVHPSFQSAHLPRGDRPGRVDDPARRARGEANPLCRGGGWLGRRRAPPERGAPAR